MLVKFAVVLSIFVVSVGGFSVSSCQADGWFPDTYSLTPETPCPGDTIVFSASGTNDKYEHVNGGTMDIGVTLDGFPIATLKWNLCDQKGLKLSCPINKGPFGFEYSQVLPGFIPCGNYQIQLKAKDLSQTELMCLNIDFTVPNSCCGYVENDTSKTQMVIEQ